MAVDSKYLSVLILCAATALGQKADVLFFNGKIVTVDSKFRIVEAMAVRRDRILALGERGDVTRLAARKQSASTSAARPYCLG
ncbi:MAG: hypothetical protein WKF37_13170 [Bryobacteraceae bacterium]